MPASDFLALVARYCSGEAPLWDWDAADDGRQPSAAGSLDQLVDAVVAGTPKLFLFHARFVGDENPPEAVTPEAERKAARPDKGRGELAVTAIPPPDVDVVAVGRSRRGEPVIDADDWRCVRCMVLNFPDQNDLAVRACIKADVDPTALGPVAEALEAAEGCSDDTWEGLVTLYRTSGVGLWPQTQKLLRMETGRREAQGESSDELD